MKLVIATSLLIATALPATVLAQAQTQTRDAPAMTQPQRMQKTQQMTAKEFMTQAWNINNFEIQAGREAQDKAKSAETKDFARMIVDDHTKMQDELKAATKNVKGMEWPNKADAEHSQKLQQLGAATNFDRDFRTQQIEGHQNAIRLFQDFAANGDNQELKTWAKNSVAMLEKHLQRAEALPASSGVM